VAAAPPYPRPGKIPGQQGYDGDGVGHVPLLEFVAERFGNAKRPGLEIGSAPMLGKDHRPAGQAGQVDSFPRRECRLDESVCRDFTIGGGVRDQRPTVCERGQRDDVPGNRLSGRDQRVGGESPPSAAHLLPDHLLRAVHPVSIRFPGRAPLVGFSGYAIELCYSGSRPRKDLSTRRLIVVAKPVHSRSIVRVEHLRISRFAVLLHHPTAPTFRPGRRLHAATGFYPFRTILLCALAGASPLAASSRSVKRPIAASMSAKFCCSL